MNKQQAQKGQAPQGQAIVELLIVLPILFFLMIFSFQIFKSIYQAQLTQESARMHLLRQIHNRANGWGGMPSREVISLPSSPIQTRGLPLLEGENPSGSVTIKIGICRDNTC